MMKQTGPIRTVAIVLLCGLGGCRSRPITNTPRSAVEQLLLSGAVDRALDRLRIPEVVGKKLYLDFTNLKGYDVEYVRVATRVRFAHMGATLVEKAEEADYTVEVALGSLGTEFKSSVVGLPALPVPNSPVPTPEVPAYRSGEQTGIVKLLVFIHQKGRLVLATHSYAKCDRVESFLMGWRFTETDQVREGWERSDVEVKRPPGR